MLVCARVRFDFVWRTKDNTRVWLNFLTLGTRLAPYFIAAHITYTLMLMKIKRFPRIFRFVAWCVFFLCVALLYLFLHSGYKVLVWWLSYCFMQLYEYLVRLLQQLSDRMCKIQWRWIYAMKAYSVNVGTDERELALAPFTLSLSSQFVPLFFRWKSVKLLHSSGALCGVCCCQTTNRLQERKHDSHTHDTDTLANGCAMRKSQPKNGKYIGKQCDRLNKNWMPKPRF